MTRRAVRFKLSGEILANLLMLYDKRIVHIEKEPFTDTFVFLVEGSDLPKVNEGEAAPLWELVYDKQKNEIRAIASNYNDPID